MKISPLYPGGRLLGVVTAGAVALSLYGCGDEQPPKPVAKTSPPAAPAPETRAAPAPEKPAAASNQADADQALAARVKSALAATAGLNAHPIDVTAKNGIVTLFGTTETMAKREAAGKAAAAVAGVKSVDNKLAVVAGS
jgi:hyperosmotically inducible protein